MSALSLPGPPAGTLRDVRAWAQQHSFGMRLAVVLLAVGGAYHYSLLTLVRALGLDTPLAYLGLVPLMALGIGLARARPPAGEPDIHDREVDVIVGLPLIIIALAMITVMPNRLSSLFWVYRVDLLSLPLFVAGVVALVFGTRALYRMRVAVGFLLLAWPLPWTTLLDRFLDSFTQVTINGLKAALAHVPVATAAPGSDGSLFAIAHGATSFTVSVASSCSGVNGVVGFLLVGVAATVLVRGRRWVKILWLAAGMTLIWALNIARLLLIFWGGRTWGEGFAIEGLHPVIGLVLFCVGLVVMASVMGRIGLTLPVSGRTPSAPAAVAASPVHLVAVPRARAAVVLLLVLSATMGVANASFRQFGLVAGDLGAARLAGFQASPATAPGYVLAGTTEYQWAQRFFGSDSNWTRYSYASTAGGAAAVTADVIDISDLSRFDTYGIEACYRFHGYSVQGQRAVTLPGGIRATVLTYTNPAQHQTWNVVHWIWPVMDHGKERFERIALLSTGQGTVYAAGPNVGANAIEASGGSALGGTLGQGLGSGRPVEAQLAAGRESLLRFAAQVIAERPSAPTAATKAVVRPGNGS